MDLATIIILAGTFIAAVVFLLDKYLHNNIIATRKHLLVRFREIKEKNVLLQEEFEELIAIQRIWGIDTIIGSDTSLLEYFETLKEKEAIEYSDLQYKKLQKVRLTKEVISDQMEKFKYHQELLALLQCELTVQKQKVQEKFPGTIEFS